MAEKSVTIKIIGDAKSATGAFKEVEVSAGKMETGLGRVASTAAGFAIGGALTQLPGLLMDGAKGAAEDEAAMLRLQQAVKNSGSAYEDYGSTIDDAIKKGQDLAFTDGETADALTHLISMTGSTEEGMARLSAAQDLARGTGISLEQAAKLLGKTSDENTAALGRLGIRLGENATAQDVLNAVDEKYKGQAGVFAESQAGQMLKAQQSAGELAETFGSFLLPVIALVTAGMLSISTALQEQVAPALQGMIDSLQPVIDIIVQFVTEHLEPFKVGLAAIAAVIVASVIPSLVAMVVAALPIIATLAAVGAAAALLYAAWESNFLGIQDITASVIGWLQSNVLPVLQTIFDGIMTGVEFVRQNWDTVWNAIRGVVEVVFPIIATVVTTYIAILKKEIEIGLAAARAVFDLVFPAIRTVVETVLPIIAQVVTTNIAILQTAIETGVAAAKWAFDNVFVPIQGIVNDVFTTIAGLVSSLWEPAVTAIGVGVDTVKTTFDGIVVIQGIISDVFSTISGLIEELWNLGAVQKVANGIGTIKGLFDYNTFLALGASVYNGIIDGMAPVVDAINVIIDGIIDAYNKIPSFLRPGSPSKWAREQSKSVVDGLVLELQQGLPRIEAEVNKIIGVISQIANVTHLIIPGQYGSGGGSVGGGMGGQYGAGGSRGGSHDPYGGGGGPRDPRPDPGGRDPRGGAPYSPGGGGRDPRGGGNYGGGTGGRGGGRPGDPGYVGPGIIGDPASGYVGPDLYNNGGKGSGGGSSIGMMGKNAVGANGVPTGGPASGLSPASSGQASMGGTDAGLAALEAGAVFLGCSWSLVGSSNDNGLFLFPNGEKHWRSTRFCRDGNNGPTATDLAQAARAIERREEQAAAALVGTIKSSDKSSTTYYGAPVPKAPAGAQNGSFVKDASGKWVPAGGQQTSHDFEQKIERAVERGIRRGLAGAV